MEVENRNMEKLRRLLVWQLMVDKWNDPLFLPISAALPGVYSECAWPILVVFDTVSHMQQAISEKVEER